MLQKLLLLFNKYIVFYALYYCYYYYLIKHNNNNIYYGLYELIPTYNTRTKCQKACGNTICLGI